MSILGADGRPMSASRSIFGASKSIDDMPMLGAETISEMYEGMKSILDSGQPLEVPAAMPMGQLASIAITLKRLHERVVELEAQLADASEDAETVQSVKQQLLDFAK